MLASALSPLAFFATAKLISRSERRVASSIRTFSSNRNRIGVDDDIVVPSERACVPQGSSNLLARERSHESILNVLDTFSGRKHFHNMPDHDAGALKRGLAVTNLGVSDDVLIYGDAFVHNTDSVAQGAVKKQWSGNDNAEKAMKWAKIRSIGAVAAEQEEIIPLRRQLAPAVSSELAFADVITENAALADGAPPKPQAVRDCEAGPETSARVAEQTCLSRKEVMRPVHKAAEGLEPPRFGFSGPASHHAAAYSGFYHENESMMMMLTLARKHGVDIRQSAQAILRDLSSKLQVPESNSIAFGGIR